MFFTREELFGKYKEIKWISPYSKIVAMYSDGLVEIHEFHSRSRCIGGAAWEVYHYPRVSNLIVNARREGARNVFVVRIGKTKLKLIPGIAGAGIEEVSVEKNEIGITYSGLAGGGIAATICRGMAEGVKGIEIIEEGGGGKLGKAKLILPMKRKVVIGVDDTDNKESGATWSLVNEISYELETKGFGDYLNHVIVQLYPKTPHKTTNCVSIAVTFAVKEDKVNELIERFKKLLDERSLSDETAIAIYKKIAISESLKLYGLETKKKIIELKYTNDVAIQNGVELIPIKGERGKIGALAAVAFENNPDEAVKII
ncbi:hypothetical protein DRO97_04205 [Archaeoglobales archaeon]|nr:MAG: hypothetical protein DRO97_04205 [Archaeoglobales archaeon]